MVARIRKDDVHSEPWDASVLTAGREAQQHVLVSILGAKDDLRLIRHGALLAEQVSGRLTVLYVLVERNGSRPVEMLSAERLFALSVGAPLVEAPATSVAEGVAQYAAERGVTHIVVSDERRTPWYAARHNAIVDDLLDRLEGVEVFVLGTDRLAVRG